MLIRTFVSCNEDDEEKSRRLGSGFSSLGCIPTTKRRGGGSENCANVGQPGSENCPPATRVPTRPFSDGGEDARPLAFANDPLILALMGWG